MCKITLDPVLNLGFVFPFSVPLNQKNTSDFLPTENKQQTCGIQGSVYSAASFTECYVWSLPSQFSDALSQNDYFSFP